MDIHLNNVIQNIDEEKVPFKRLYDGDMFTLVGSELAEYLYIRKENRQYIDANGRKFRENALEINTGNGKFFQPDDLVYKLKNAIIVEFDF